MLSGQDARSHYLSSIQVWGPFEQLWLAQVTPAACHLPCESQEADSSDRLLQQLQEQLTRATPDSLYGNFTIKTARGPGREQLCT